MDIKIIEKTTFAVIGKVGVGLSKEGFRWIPPLWNDANSHFHEISKLAKVDHLGNIVGIWGAMSDVDEKFERWNESGKYLAGCEVYNEAVAPNGWVKWIIPSYKYLVSSCTQETYEEVFNYMVSGFIPDHKYSIVGAVHEFYNPKVTNGELNLYFPIEKLKSEDK
ncbi:MAG: effector-binding protein [Haloplasmataceae bacterium]|nr:effector-binding protein [Haloplasmataceae bacterium]